MLGHYEPANNKELCIVYAEILIYNIPKSIRSTIQEIIYLSSLIMTENLQDLLNRIQNDGVNKAAAAAAEIVLHAKEQAAQIVRDAETQARVIVAKAETKTKAFEENSIRVLEQAGRDLLISIGKRIEILLEDIVLDSVGNALSPEILAEMMVTLATAYAEKGFSESKIEMMVSAEDQKTIVKLFMQKYRDKIKEGVEIHADDTITSGFRISFKSDHVFHDFTHKTLADALCYFLRPHLAGIVHRVAHGVIGST